MTKHFNETIIRKLYLIYETQIILIHHFDLCYKITIIYLDRKWKVEIHFCIQYSVHTCKYWICEVLKRLYHHLKRNSYLLISREKDSWPGLDVKLRGILKCLLCFLTKTFSVILSFRYLRQYWFYKYLRKLT